MKVIIIGGIAAGMSAAAKLKRMSPNDEVIVYEKGDIVSFGACGLPYYAGGFFDDSNEMIARTAEEFRKTGINLFTNHEVLEVDFDNKKLRVKDLIQNMIIEERYDKLMIASGASSIIPPIKGIDSENVLTLKSMDDGNKLRALMENENLKRVTVIGAGFIGVEAVEAAKKRGKEVTVVQLQDRILAEVFDEEITNLLEEEIRKHDVNLLLDETVMEITTAGKATNIKTNKREFETDIVIVATGFRPNTAFVKNEKLEMLKNGAIVVDKYGRTSIEDVYAAGDCATINSVITNKPVYVPLATGANKLGRIVGENLAGANNEFQGSLASSCIKVMDMEAARTGLSEKEVKALGFDYKTKFITDMNHTSYYPGQTKIYVKLIYDAHTKVIYGGQVAGYKDAVQRCNVIATCIFAKMTTAQLGMLDLSYAPPFSRTWDVLNVAGNVSK
ncbi:CoA-disulfide reductase [Clostridium sp. 29_15]|uniref:CoA-disulfide reductase n=1 Tax=Clostridium sp. 29_15 TaxID=1896982 RepID=UPI00095918DA|nr:CoA-disulfide reductase [Clostridium sp. 29_15]OKZ85515.1 MAG: CoA-disulfide reductase [Clostridium sp. 29_15]